MDLKCLEVAEIPESDKQNELEDKVSLFQTAQ